MLKQYDFPDGVINIDRHFGKTASAEQIIAEAVADSQVFSLTQNTGTGIINAKQSRRPIRWEVKQ